MGAGNQYSREDIIARLSARREWFANTIIRPYPNSGGEPMAYAKGALSEMDNMLAVLRGEVAIDDKFPSPAEPDVLKDAPASAEQNIFVRAKAAIEDAYEAMDAGITREDVGAVRRMFAAIVGGMIGLGMTRHINYGEYVERLVRMDYMDSINRLVRPQESEAAK